MTPLTDDFDPNLRIENSGSVRLTSSGLKFLQDNIGALAQQFLGSGNGTGVMTFPIPQTSGSQLGGSIDYNVCPDGPNEATLSCIAEIDLGNADLTLATQTEHNLTITGTLPLRLKDLPVKLKTLWVFDSTVHATLTGNGSCPGDNQEYAQIPISVDIAISIDDNAAHSRHGYSRVKVNKVEIDQGKLKSSFKFCEGFISGILNWDLVKDLLVGQLVSPLTDTITDQADAALCQKANPDISPTCPTGTTDVDGVCRYGSDDKAECAAILLGTSGNINLGGLLASISPGAKGGFDFMLAVGGEGARNDGTTGKWGDLNPINGGATLGMYGGAKAAPVSGCVNLSTLALPPGIPIPTELTDNTVKDWPAGVDGPHLGIALSEEYTNYALAQMYNSGFLCIGLSTESQAMLTSGLFSILASSLKDLGIQRESQQIAIVVRPNEAPTMAFGNGTNADTDPVMRLGLKNASFDFYVWSLDRFIRFMTATYDLDIPINLTVTPEGLAPVIEKLGVGNGTVTNSSLLREDPAALSGAIASLLEGQVGQALGGGIKPIDLNSALSSTGMELFIPESVEGQGSPGLRKLEKDSHNFLGIFASLKMLEPGQNPITSATTLEIFDKTIDKEGLSLETISATNAPKLRLQASSNLDGPQMVEYAYRVDQGVWHPWTRDRVFDIQDNYLRLQGRHVISARSRVVGQPMTQGAVGTVEVLVDVDAPSIKVSKVNDGRVSIDVRDLVSNSDATQVRTRLDDEAWSKWQAASALSSIAVGDATTLAIEAKDEEGNIASTQQALIRGRASDVASGCGCSVPGRHETNGRGLALLGVALLGVFARLSWRRGAKGTGSAAQTIETAVAPPARVRSRRSYAARSALGGVALLAVAGSWPGCSCGDTDSPGAGGKQTPPKYSCEAPDCEALLPGLAGAYTSVAVSGKDIWVAGYGEADWSNDMSWGDLLVGKWDEETQAVAWAAIDGVPEEPEIDEVAYDKEGFRGGQTEAGDDVGTWTSIAINDGNPAVAYYDRTNKALKFAQFDGEKWTISTVEQKEKSDRGKYAKLLFVGGKPSIAYLAIEAGGASGKITSKVRIATGNAAVPTSWAFEDAVVDTDTPCRDAYCAAGSKCLAATAACTPTIKGCAEECAAGTACVSKEGTPSCEDIFDKKKLDAYPDAVGDYISIAPDNNGGFGIAYYDRIHGNLNIASKLGGAWKKLIVDGATPDGATDTGDVGIGASLFIDATGNWHVTYVDGLNEALHYVKITGGTTPGIPSRIDDGLGLGSDKFVDGLHMVGDDSHVSVTASGEIRVTYQDASAGKLRYAVGTPGTDKVTWSLKEIGGDGFGGAFSQIIEVDGQQKLVHWWRVGGDVVRGDVAIVSP
jgi:hypothetical protein